MDNSSRIVDVDINDILPNRNQPRIILNEEDDLGLTDSVKEYGVLQPIIVRSIGDKYEIIAGERRYRASVLAGKETVPVIIRNMTDRESAEIALIENIQRKSLTPIEEALSYKNLLDLGYTQEQLAEKLGKSQPTVANKIRLLNLTDEVQEALLDNEISERHARSLLKIKNKQQQREMLRKIIEERLTVRKTDEEINKLDLGKGEEEMNNNELNNMPQFESFGINPQPVVNPVETPAQPAGQFDMLAEQPQPVNPVVQQFTAPEVTPVAAPAPEANIFAAPEVAPVAETVAPAAGQFDIFAEAPAQPVAPAPEANIFAAPEVTPVAEPVAPAAGQFDIFAEQPQPTTFEVPQQTVAAPAPSIFAAPEVTPVVEPIAPAIVPEAPAIEPVAPVAPVAEPIAPVAPVVEPAPVAEQPVDVIATAPIQDQPAAPATMPEPIIITDYNKQYDPVMPQQQAAPVQQVNFKEVIAAIRECANKIESYGYKIDVDEFDLTNIYQAIFKIEKM